MDLKSGIILNNNQTNENYGVLVKKLNNKDLIVFRLQDNSFPVISKLKYNDNISKIGHINEYKNQNLKEQLLKYYRTRNITANENKVLDTLMKEAFPLGIPLYRPEIPITSEEMIELLYDVEPSAKLHLNTTDESSISNLNDNVVYVVNITTDGMWIAKPNNEINKTKFYYLFNNDTENKIGNRINQSYSGISRIQVLNNENKEDGNWIKIMDKFNDYSSNNDTLTTDMICKGHKVKVDVNTRKPILPTEYNDMIYDINQDTFVKEELPVIDKLIENEDCEKEIEVYEPDVNSENINNDEMSDEDLIPDETIYNCNENKLENNKNIEQKGGKQTIKKYKSTKSISRFNDINKDEEIFVSINDNFDDFDISIGMIDFEDYEDNDIIIKKDDYEDEDISFETEDEDTDFEVDEEFELEEDINIVEINEKVERITRAEEDKVYNENIQKYELFKKELEAYPLNLRNNEIINRIVKKKVVDIITLQKKVVINSNTDDIKFITIDDKPILEQYMKGNFQNNLLIPLVVSSKKIFLNPNSKILDVSYNLDTHSVIKDPYELYNGLNTIIENKENINYKNVILNIINYITPYKSTKENRFFNINIGDGIKTDDLTNLTLDTMVYRYCDDTFSCQSFEIISNDVDYQVYLGPVVNNFNRDEKTIIDGKLRVNEDLNILKRGENLNIIGFIRMPLNKEVNSNDIEGFETEIIHTSELNEDFNLFKNPDKILMFVLPKDINNDRENIRNILDNIIPDFDDIITANRKKLKYCYNLRKINDILKNYGYDIYQIGIEKFNKIIDIQKKECENYIKLLENIKDNKSLLKLDKNDINIITDDIIEEFEKIYNIEYLSRETTLDSDYTRLEWIKSFENSDYIYNFLLNEYYKLVNPEEQIANLKEILVRTESEFNYLNEQYTNKNYNINNRKCNKIGKTRIVRYNTIQELENGNGRDVYDTEGNIIREEDLAILGLENNLSVFRRKLIGKKEMWVKENKAVLYQILEEEKRECEKTDELDLNKSECSYDLEESKCENKNMFNDNTEISNVKDNIEDIKNEIEYYMEIFKQHKIIDKNVKEFRRKIRMKNSIVSKFEKYLDGIKKRDEKRLMDDLKLPINCVHFQAVNKLFSMRNLEIDEYYRLAGIILDKFLNNDIEYDITNSDINEYGKCFICNQNLLCKHFIYAVNNLREFNDVKEKELIALYGTDINKAFHCKICLDYFINSDILDITRYGKGQGLQGMAIKDREVLEEVKQDIYSNIETFITNLGDLDKYKFEYYSNLTKLCGLYNKILKEDNEFMYSLINGYDYEKIEMFKFMVKRDKPNLPEKIVSFTSDLLYKLHVYCDISAMFLIMLQTSTIEYRIRNKFCGSNYYGFPIVNNIEGESINKSGINFVLCLVRQISKNILYNKYLKNDAKVSSTFMKRLIKMVNTNEMIKNRLNIALESKNKKINNIIDFENNYTNNWSTFKPILGDFNISWEPEKMLSKKDTENVNGRTINKMIKVSKQNNEYYSLQIMKLIDNIIGSSKPINMALINNAIENSCCIDNIIKSDIKSIYFFNRESDNEIEKLIEKLYNTSINYNILNDKIDRTWIKPMTLLLEKPSFETLDLEFNIKDDEIKDLYLTYIDTGINIGMKHIFDRYGRCILSNKFKDDIENTKYTPNDYKKINNIITNKNVKVIDERDMIIDENNNLYLDELRKLIIKIKDDNLNIIMDELFNNNIKTETLHLFEVQNFENIEVLSNVIGKGKDNVSSIKETLSNFGDFKNHYNDETNKNILSLDTIIYNRNKIKETNYKKALNHLIYCISQIKNKFIKNMLIENMRPRYKFIHKYRNNYNIFNKIYNKIEPLIKLFKKLSGKQYNNLINTDIVVLLKQYIFIKILVQIITITENNYQKGGKADEKDFDINKDDVEDIYVNDEEDYNNNIIFDDKDTSELNIVISFTREFIIDVNKIYKSYDFLTKDNVNKLVKTQEEKKQRRNLNAIKIITNDEDLAEEAKIFKIKLAYGMLDYSELGNVLAELNIEDKLLEENIDEEEQPRFIGEDDEGLNNEWNNFYGDEDDGVPDDGFELDYSDM